MGLLNELGLPAGGAVNINDVAREVAAGGLVPEGVHHAILESVGSIPNAEGRGWKMTFKVVAGPGKDETVEDVVWKPKGDDAKKDKAVANRTLIFAHRLGLVDEKGVEKPGKYGFADCLGAPCFIEVKHEDETYKPKDKDGKEIGVTRVIKKAKLTFEGVLSPDDKKCKDVPKAANLPAASSIGKPAAAGAAPAKDQYADI